MKYVILLLIILCLTITADATEDYKCAADLFPGQAVISGIMKLGESRNADGETYRVMAECKQISQNIWLQFIDSTNMKNSFPSETGVIDNKCDYVVKIGLVDRTFKFFGTQSYEIVMESLKAYCNRQEKDIKEFIHYAEPVVE